jgi:anti-sigma regulatory factor (Ser/Thr protein kinase)
MYDCQLALEPAAESLRISREAVRPTLTSVDPESVELAAILTDEVVANAIKHGEPPIELALGGGDDRIEVAVTDRGAELPVLRTPEPAAQSGRRMRIVALLSDEWRVEELPRGKRIWFRLDLPRSGGRTLSVPADGEERRHRVKNDGIERLPTGHTNYHQGQ